MLTWYGLAAYEWREEQLKMKRGEPAEEVPLLDRVQSVLTPNQGHIMKYLLKKKTASYHVLKTIPDGWRDEPSDEAITKQLKEMKGRLEEANLPVGYITISVAKRRVTLEDR